MKDDNPTELGILRFPTGGAGRKQLRDLVNVLQPNSDTLYIVSGNKAKDIDFEKNIKFSPINHKKGKTKLTRIIRYLVTQVMLTLEMLNHNKIDKWFFFGGDLLLIPLFTCKLLQKKVALLTVSHSGKASESGDKTFSELFYILNRLCYDLSTLIILYSSNLIKEWELEKYRDKIQIAHKHYLNFETFSPNQRLSERDEVIGFVGSLIKRKNVMSLIKAAKRVKQKKPEVEFYIIGEGPEEEKIKRYIKENDMREYVHLLGWVQHEELPRYLNEMKLFVFPTHHEGLPNVVLEAMACGTPVLATPTDAIPDVIDHKENGFLLNGKTPEDIEREIIDCLSNENLEEISKNGIEYVRKNFNYEVAVKQHLYIIKKLKNS